MSVFRRHCRHHLRPLGLLPYLLQDWETTHDLPSKKSETEKVGTDVNVAGAIVALLHEGDGGDSSSPRNDETGTRVQVRAGEKLPGTGVRV